MLLSWVNKKSKKKQRIFLSTEGNFCGINLNARSIVNKLRDLQSILMAPKPLVIVISETWLLSSISDLEIILPGYKIYRNTEIIEEVELLCCTNHYKFKYYPISRGIECIIVKVFLDYFHLVIAGFYRPLKCAIYFDNLIEFLSKTKTSIFEKILSVHINKFISKYILSPHQHSFRPHKSTSSAVFTLTHVLNTALQEKNFGRCLFRHKKGLQYSWPSNITEQD